MKDSLSDMEFLIDSGSTVRIIPLSYVDNEEPATSRNLFALNLAEAKTYGKRKLTIDIGLGQKEMELYCRGHCHCYYRHRLLILVQACYCVGAKRLIEIKKSNVLKLAEPKSKVSQESPCKVLIVKEQCFNTLVHKQMVINDFPFLLLF